MDLRKIIEDGRRKVPCLRPDEIIGLMTNIEATGSDTGVNTRAQELAGVRLTIRSYDTLRFDEETNKRVRNTVLTNEGQTWKITYHHYDFKHPRRTLQMQTVEDMTTFSGDIEQFKKDMSLIRLFDAIETLDWSKLGREV